MSGSFVTIVVVFVLIFQLKRILGFLNLSKVRMRASEGRPVLRARIPEHTRHLLDSGAEAVSALGFELIGAQAFESLNTCDPRSHTYSDFHWHPEKAVLAIVEPAPGMSGQATQVQFVTMFSDGSSLMTVNRHKWEMMPMPDDVTVVDALADNLPAQWAYHLQALAGDKRAHAAVTEKLRVLNRLADILTPRVMEHLIEIGWAREETASPRAARGAIPRSCAARQRWPAARWRVLTNTTPRPTSRRYASTRCTGPPQTSNWAHSPCRRGSRWCCSRERWCCRCWCWAAPSARWPWPR